MSVKVEIIKGNKDHMPFVQFDKNSTNVNNQDPSQWSSPITESGPTILINEKGEIINE
jgi:hypothetical protein